MKEINPQSTNSISVKYSDVNIYIDGIRTNPKNSSGECVNPIFYKNDIYLPISFISEFTDKKISIDNTMKNIFIGDSPFLINNINDICTPISKTNCRIEKIFTFNGKTYKNALIFSIGKSEHYADVYYKFNGLYNKITLELIKIENSDEEQTSVWVMKDKTDIKKINLEENEKKKIIEINLKNTDIFRLYILSYAQRAKFAVVNINAE